MIAAWRKVRGFEGRAHVGTWLYRVATNAAIDEVRRKARRPAPSGDMAPRRTEWAAVEDAVSDRMAVDWAMTTLPPQFRAAEPVLVRALLLVGFPGLGAVAGAFMRFQGRGARLFGVTLGVFFAGLLLMVLYAYWVYGLLAAL